jgi:hypothetical protein
VAYPGVDIPATGRLAALFRVPIDYVLEVRVQGKITSAISVPNYPGGIVLEQPHATSVRHTLGDEPVREGTVNRTRNITIRGNSGYAARAGYNETGQVIFANGPIIVREFQGFLDNYQKLLAALGEDMVDMVFRAFEEKWNYRCEVGVLVIDRGAERSPTTWDWHVTLKGYLDAPPNDPINLLSPVSDWFEEAARTIQLANAYIAVAGNAAQNLRGDLESLRAPLQALQQTGQALQAVTQGSRDLARFPADMVADFSNAAVSFKSAWEDITGGRFDDPLGVNGWTALQGEWELLQTRLGYAAEDSARESMTVLGYSGGSPTDLEASDQRAAAVGPLDGLYPRPGPRNRRDATETTPVQLRPRENLRDLAERYYGDPDEWIVIAAYNGWQSAHRLGSGRPARRGDWVFIPRRDLSPKLLHETDLYLEDIYLTHDGDLEFIGQDDPTGFKMDLRTIRGAANLRQALTGRLTTAAGDSRGFPRYGLPRVVGTGMNSSVAAYVAGHLRDQLLRDSRVDTVQNLSVSDGGDRLVAEGEVTPKDSAGSTVRLLAPLPPAA